MKRKERIDDKKIIDFFTSAYDTAKETSINYIKMVEEVLSNPYDVRHLIYDNERLEKGELNYKKEIRLHLTSEEIEFLSSLIEKFSSEVTTSYINIYIKNKILEEEEPVIESDGFTLNNVVGTKEKKYLVIDIDVKNYIQSKNNKQLAKIKKK